MSDKPRRSNRYNNNNQYGSYGFYGRSDHEPKYVDTYSAINHVTGEYIPCKNMEHSKAVAFGRNKKCHNQHWMACWFSDGKFIVL